MELDSKLLPEIDLQTEAVLPIHTDAVCRPLENIRVKQEPYFNMAGYGTSPSENTEHVDDIANTVDVKPKVIDDSHPEIYTGHNHGLCSNGNCVDTGIPHDTHMDLVKSEPKYEQLETTDHTEFIIEIDTCKDEYYETHGYPHHQSNVDLELGESGVGQASGGDCVTNEDMHMKRSATQLARWAVHTSVDTKPCTVVVRDIRYAYPDIVTRRSVHVHDREPTIQILAQSTNFVHSLQQSKHKPHMCSVSGVGFARRGNMNTNKRIHTGEKPYNHTVCGDEFTRKHALKMHTRIHTGEKPHKCSVCEVSFTRKDTLTSHMRTHTGEKGDMKKHMRIHTGEKPHNCDVCEITFIRKDYLTSHMKTHTGEKPHRCSVCGNKFAHKHQLMVHNRIHTGEKPHKCSICGIVSVTKSSRNTHAIIHTGGKPHKCSICERCFTRKSNLISHMRTHTGEKPYKCTICGKLTWRNTRGYTQERSLITVLCVKLASRGKII